MENLRMNKMKIQLLRSQIAELEEIMLSVRTSKISDMPKGQGVDKIAELIDKKDRLKKKYINDIAELLKQIEKAEKFIDTLEDKRYQNALRLRFYEGKTWAEVAEIMGYEQRTIYDWWRKIKTH